ncbi:hypothetical protein BZA70DRAFT_271287 [Myxozyma melibiosi]|uniref:LYR motif-containing protein 2 n=1 Tax=Myxozyma melibiosi TaxID=54550 RepID=A0ABR1FCE9_9ASCO
MQIDGIIRRRLIVSAGAAAFASRIWFSSSARCVARFDSRDPPLTLAHFVQASAARQLWRTCLRTIKGLPDRATRKEMASWARHEFESHRHERDLEQIKYLIANGRKQLEIMAETLMRSGVR